LLVPEIVTPEVNDLVPAAHITLLFVSFKESNVVDLFMGSNFKGGYGWIFPKDSETAIVGYGTLSKECFSDVEKYLRRMWKIKKVTEKCSLKPLGDKNWSFKDR